MLETYTSIYPVANKNFTSIIFTFSKIQKNSEWWSIETSWVLFIFLPPNWFNFSSIWKSNRTFLEKLFKFKLDFFFQYEMYMQKAYWHYRVSVTKRLWNHNQVLILSWNTMRDIIKNKEGLCIWVHFPNVSLQACIRYFIWWEKQFCFVNV